ncbi:asparagine synthase (glutamine-hydrolyzing) [Nonomuraea ceibae]|uniref:asparagine synthase (glutamine-hydrolyzing) n=1 Tax=Nonomuraea ceibae TaxID=1935170 RepID=UPI001C5F52B4|nr:asparagine synthase (glutamine-hydrolyzing) [Nonomuraea ceibae]
MCGIAGWIEFGRAPSEAITAAMTATLACRGPDGQGLWTSPHASLGQRRLSVIDVEHGNQPMTVETASGPVVIVYSGETYNFAELRRQLGAAGHRFRTRSDTEVVLHAYLQWGPAAAERMDGMFAFAIWDGREEKLVLARDRMGVKPLFVHALDNGVLFGSEPKAILAHPSVTAAVDLDGFRELFSMVKSPRQSVWSGISEIEPGTTVVVDRDGSRESVYWRLTTESPNLDLHKTVEHVAGILQEGVRRQLVSDVPLCTLLSGGLDSSTLTALAAAELAGRGQQLRSFSVDFEGQTADFRPDALRPAPDTPFAHEVAAHVRSHHTDVVLTPETLADPKIRELVIRAYDLPMGHGDMDASMLLLFKAIREQAVVALSGESADELFGGYHQFFSPQGRAETSFPWLADPHLPQYAAISPRQPSVFHPEFQRALALPDYVQDSYSAAVSAIERAPGEDQLEWTMRKITYLYLTRFVRLLLDRQDRLSMAVGLEIRVPFCDHRLVSAVYNAPWRLKHHDGCEKSLLRSVAAPLLPLSVIQRKKSPYPSTQNLGYMDLLKIQARDLLTDRSNAVFTIVDPAALKHAANSTSASDSFGRFVLERSLDIAAWMDAYQPTLKV